MTGELEILRRAHELFSGMSSPPEVTVAAAPPDAAGRQGGRMAAGYRSLAANRREQLADSRAVDTELARVLSHAARERDEAYRRTAAVLQAARSDAATAPDNPIAARELLRRRARRLRLQRLHVLTARRQARRRRSQLRALRYRTNRAATRRGGRQDTAVRAALSRLGRPYVWGATGPNRFDCSGLVQWAYAQAGVRLHRTTYEQIHDGVPVARSQVRAGDLIFPHRGHVQLAIGGGLVVEAPHAGATVQISRIGDSVAIRRPLS